MPNRFASLALIIALVSTIGGTSAFANTPSDPEPASKETATPAESGTATKNAAKRNEQLKTNMLKLVADAKAGKIAPTAKPQIQPAKSNNWSTGTKIAVGVAVAVAVIVVILVVKHKVDHSFDGLSVF